MKYLCMGFHDEKQWEAMPSNERDDLIQESRAYEEVLRRNGHYIHGEALESVRNAATLRFRDGRMSITDGPFAETKEQLGGFVLIEANDLNHAIQLMSNIPCMRAGGSIEIRPINEATNAEMADRATLVGSAATS